MLLNMTMKPLSNLSQTLLTLIFLYFTCCSIINSFNNSSFLGCKKNCICNTNTFFPTHFFYQCLRILQKDGLWESFASIIKQILPTESFVLRESESMILYVSTYLGSQHFSVNHWCIYTCVLGTVGFWAF